MYGGHIAACIIITVSRCQLTQRNKTLTFELIFNNAVTRGLLNAKSVEGANTALHLAAMSRHVGSHYIRQLSELDPAALNDRDMTPLQTAANNPNFSPDAVVAMLETYLPGIDIASVDAGNNNKSQAFSFYRVCSHQYVMNRKTGIHRNSNNICPFSIVFSLTPPHVPSMQRTSRNLKS
jgi:hypothetical protein